MRLQNWLKKYWVFPLAIIVFTWYIVPKWKLQNDLRKRGKCTIGIVKSEIKFTSFEHFYYIEYKVEDTGVFFYDEFLQGITQKKETQFY